MTYRATLTLLLAGGLAACANTVSLTVESEIPVPVVAQIPLTVGVYYDEALRNHVYTEDSPDRPNWNIQSGASQVELFDQILPSLFQNVEPVTGTTAAGASVPLDAIIAPRVEEMQFALPNETKSGMYEAWIKYEINLYNPEGTLIANWPVTGYGKTSTEFLKSKDDGLNSAINLALRDAGAKLALGFDSNNEVQRWISSKTGKCYQDGEGC